jgi:purine-binding chemotaxis protein CheW
VSQKSKLEQSASDERRIYITFKMGDELFAIDVQHVREVIDLSPIARVPTAPAHLRGVVNVRGKAVPVVDLRRKFGLPDTAATVHTRILILELSVDNESYVIGGLADSVHDVIELAAKDLAPPPRLAARWRSEVITGLAERDGEFIMMLDVQHVFELDDVMASDGVADPEQAEPQRTAASAQAG